MKIIAAPVYFSGGRMNIINTETGLYWNLSGQAWVTKQTASQFSSERFLNITLARINGGWYS